MPSFRSLFSVGVLGVGQPRLGEAANGGHKRMRSNDRKHSTEVESRDLINKEGVIKQGMDEESFASGMPLENSALKDKMDSHRAGTFFKYAVITNKPSDERQSMLSKLRSFKPQSQVTNLSLNDIPPIRLVGEVVSLDLKQILTPEIMRNGEDYLQVDCILIHFIPLDSFANDKSVVNVQINDFRKISNTAVRSAKVDNTMGYNILFFLDYCVEKRDVNKINLSFSCSTKEFQAGIAWGAVKVIAQIQTRSFPVRMPLVGTMGVMLLSDTDLEDFECDPRMLDLVITPESLARLRQLNKRQEIENRTIPVTDRKELVTAKTILGDSYEEEEVGSVIGRMKEMAMLKERQENARALVKSKLKKINETSEGNLNEIGNQDMTHHVNQDSQVNDNRGVLDNLQEIGPEDSTSLRGDTASEVEESYNNALPRKVVFVVD